MAAIAGGTAAGQVLAFAAAPFLSRLFSPSEFGIFSIVLAIALILTSVASLRFDRAIPLPESDSQAFSLVILGGCSALVSALFLTPLLATAGSRVAIIAGRSDVADWVWIAPIAASVMALYQLLNALAIRRQRYGAIARRNVLQSIATVAFQVVAGIAGYQAGGLIVGLALGQLVGVVSLAAGAELRGVAAVKARTWSNLRSTASRFRKFPLALTPAGVLNTLGAQSGVLMLGACYGTSAAGLFGLTQRVLAVPVTLVGQAVAQVYLSEVARSRREKGGVEAAAFWRSSKLLLIPGTAGAIVLLVAGPQLFSLVFGETWSSSGSMAQAMGVLLACQLVASPVSQTLVIYERTGLQLAWDAGRLAAATLSVLLAFWMGLSVTAAVWSFSVVSALAYVLSWELSRRTIIGSNPA